MKQYKEEGGKEKLKELIGQVLDEQAEYGLVLVMMPDQTMDFGHNVTTVQVRDALLNYCRDIATYPGD